MTTATAAYAMASAFVHAHPMHEPERSIRKLQTVASFNLLDSIPPTRSEHAPGVAHTREQPNCGTIGKKLH